ncbi:MAG: glycosyltransferase family 4 protein [Methanomassiliicoccales archaeon]|nr:MAG: glycosyltransferase family 4 protein [Methanomassiliicoccales archaeon]
MGESLRIVQVNPFYYPFRGGIEHRIHNISKRLATKHEVHVLTAQLPDTTPREIIDGYEVVRLPSRFYGNYNPPYVSTPGLMEALEELRPDIVDLHYRWAPSYTRLARKYQGRKVFTFHNTFGEGAGLTRLPSLVNDHLWLKHLGKFEKVVCISEFIRNDLIRRGLCQERLITIPNGVDLPDGDIKIEEKDFILFVGRLVGTKGLPYLVRAMKHIDSRLVIVGGGPEEKRLKALISRTGLGSKIEMTGKVSEDRKKELLASCKLFVMPSLFESYGIAVAEAMSYGKAIVATDVGGLPEVVGQGGLLCRPRDATDLADKVNQLLSDERERMIKGMDAREHVNKFSWDFIANKYEGLINQMEHLIY